jgi:hypothetical protein
MAIEAFRVREFHAAEDEPAPGDQLMNVIADANVNHARRIKIFGDESEGKLRNSQTIRRQIFAEKNRVQMRTFDHFGVTINKG